MTQKDYATNEKAQLRCFSVHSKPKKCAPLTAAAGNDGAAPWPLAELERALVDLGAITASGELARLNKSAVHSMSVTG